MRCCRRPRSKGKKGAQARTKTAKSATLWGPTDSGSDEEEEEDDAAHDLQRETREYQAKLQFLAGVPLMKRLPKEHFPHVAKVCQPQDFAAGDTVIRQGDSGDAFYVIRHGEARVHITDDNGCEKILNVLQAGDYFGENALLRDEPRTATIIAERKGLQTFTIKRDEFQELGLNEKLQFANRRAVMGGGSKEKHAKEPSPKTLEEYQFLAKALKANENLEATLNLADARVKSLIDLMWKEMTLEGQEVITEGTLEADYFYIVEEGIYEVFTSYQEERSTIDALQEGRRRSSIMANGGMHRVKAIGPGGSFGEMALLYLVPRAATVVCKEAGWLWVIDRAQFKETLMQMSDEQKNRNIGFLNKVSILDSLTRSEKEELAKGLVEMHFTRGEFIVEQDEPGSTFYIMYDGLVEVFKDRRLLRTMLASPVNGTAQFFGEGALIENVKRTASVKVASDTAKVLALDRQSFNLLLGPFQDIIRKNMVRKELETEETQQRENILQTKVSAHVHGEIRRKDLRKVQILGVGSSSTVELVQHEKTGQTYALKGISKSWIESTELRERVQNEKTVMMVTNSPFIVKLLETYKSRQALYFLMEVCLGGDLHTAYNRKGLYGIERHCKFYIAGVVFAFEHLHDKRIIYRDLKPENLLLTDEGQVKLADMGLAKFVVNKTYTTCGTPDYMAPEIINGEGGHDKAVDWWSMGILLFELMSGYPPFEAANQMQIHANVIQGISKVPFPTKCQGRVGSLIRELLKSNPIERLPMRKGGIERLKSHEWYAETNWKSLEARVVEPPYKPVVRSKMDLANFSEVDEQVAAMAESYFEEAEVDTAWDANFATA